jgi:nanoRNase/pAp phosphatase (c-di-AMP/oligoRNAs hydrolase)
VSFTEVANLLEESKAQLVVLLCHHNADPDAICSAYAFASLLKKFRPGMEVEIGAAQGISRLSKHLLQLLPIEVKTQPNVDKAQAIALLDTNTIQQLDSLAERVRKTKAPIIVIDHHSPHPETEQIAKICITNEDSSSTCEIIYNLFKQMGAKPNENEAKALFLGIAFDTRHFVLASSTTLKNIAELIDAGVNAQETISMLSLPMDFSERVARLKASRRTRFFKIGNWIIALSHVSAYQASAARAMIELGAHVAAVAGEKNQAIEISMRSSLDFYKQAKIHLGRDIAKPLGEYLHGMGGGHATAAGVNGIGDIEIGLKRCLWLLKQKLLNHNQVATLK